MKKLFAFFISLTIAFSCTMPIGASENAVVYVCDGGIGDGSSKDSPLGTLSDAYRYLFAKSNIEEDPNAVAVIVFCGTLTVSDHFNYNGELSHKGRVIYTSSYGGESFDSRLLIHAASKSSLSVSDEHRFVLGGPTRFEDLTIDRGEGTAVSLTIYASTDLFIAESVEVVNTNWVGTYTEPFRALSEGEISSIVLSAHRGFQPMGPENSIPAFEAAGRLGFDYIETDVIMTADGELVCIHDSTLERTTNGNGKISSLTYGEIRKYSIDTASYGFDISSADAEKLYVPTFREYLEICKKYGAKPFIEIKDAREAAIRRIIDTALEYFAAEDIVMSCSSISSLEISYAYNRDVFHHLIWGDQSDQGYKNSIDALSAMTDSHGRVNAGIAFNIKGLADKANYDRAKKWIEKAHGAGLMTCLRGADDMTEVRLMFELGIDYYPTNTTSPEKLAELGEGREGGYTYSSSSGGKLFIRGGRRSETTAGDITITLLGGIYDFVAPSNAEAESTGNYSVTVGENAFVSRLVAGETAKGAAGRRSESVVTVQDGAEIRELYVAGDYSDTERVTVNILGGKVLSLSESRGNGGTARDFTLRVDETSMLPLSLSISNRGVITGEKRLEICSGEAFSDAVWDEIVSLKAEVPSVTDAAEESTLSAPEIPERTASGEENASGADDGTTIAAIVILTAALTVITSVCVRKSREKRNS